MLRKRDWFRRAEAGSVEKHHARDQAGAFQRSRWRSDAIPVTVGLFEPLSSDTLIHFSLADTPVIARVSPDLPLNPDSQVALAPAAGKAHLFDADTGEAVR
jgi:ABC-type sugar transport system ATPase subunit